MHWCVCVCVCFPNRCLVYETPAESVAVSRERAALHVACLRDKFGQLRSGQYF